MPRREKSVSQSAGMTAAEFKRKWHTFTIGDQNEPPADLDSISKLIVKTLGACLEEFFRNDKKRRRTTLIMEKLTLLGDQRRGAKPHFKVYSHGLSDKFLKRHKKRKFKNREWLYDLHWYLDHKKHRYQRKRFGYQPERLPLVVECEWSKKRKGDGEDSYGGIKYDFQKLLVTNAKLRLMICLITKYRDIEELNDYFDEAIANYKPLARRSKFLFIAFDKSLNKDAKIKGGFHYAQKHKGACGGSSRRREPKGAREARGRNDLRYE